MTMNRTWMKIGAAHTEDRERVGRILDGLQWERLLVERQYPMVPVMAIEEAAKVLRIPKITHMAIRSHEMAPYGLYGIRGAFKNGSVDIYLVDEGSRCVVIASDFYAGHRCCECRAFITGDPPYRVNGAPACSQACAGAPQPALPAGIVRRS